MNGILKEGHPWWAMAVFSITQLLFCIALLLLLVLIVIAARTPKGPRGFFVRKCPYCLGLIWSGASICSHCRRAVPKSATTASSLIGIEKVYLGYTYVVAENGEAELKLSAGEWRKFSSTQRLEEYVDGLEEYVDAGRQRDRAQD
jgi:hypothetical protein